MRHKYAQAQTSRQLPALRLVLKLAPAHGRLTSSRVFLDSSATGREAAGVCAGGGVTAETCGSRGRDLSSTLLGHKSPFRVQTVRLLFDPRIRRASFREFPALRGTQASVACSTEAKKPGPRADLTSVLEGFTAHLPQGQRNQAQEEERTPAFLTPTALPALF